MSIGRIINNGSPLFQSLRPRLVWIKPITCFRAFSQIRSRSEVDAIQKERLEKALRELVEFHKNNVKIGLVNRSKVIREAEEQAHREWNWLKDEIGLNTTKKLDAIKTEKIIRLTQRLLNNEPISYVLGNQPFGPLLIKCAPPTLIPRPETEALVEHIFDQLKDTFRQHLRQQNDEAKPLRILDLCTGSGCISLLIRHRLLELISKETYTKFQNPAFQIVGVDIADSALQLSNENLALYNHGEDYGKLASQYGNLVLISFEQVDMLNDTSIRTFIAQHGPFDAVLCNPPYIPAKEWKELDASVRDWEDRLALVGHPDNESDGLLFYRRLADLVDRHNLSASSVNQHFPLVATEVGHDQAEKVRDIFTGQKKLSLLEIWTDPFGKQRAVIAKM
ncbi:hypothetical protein L7F22_068249 [Adiantum nelumboides]|nr:hypothetical protein [Adiantum nelumboides]